MLDEIDGFLCSKKITDSEKQQLWDVLLALRGPDRLGFIEKEATTSHIRCKAFPKFTKVIYSGQVEIGADFSKGKLISKRELESNDVIYSKNRHFYQHIKDAFRTLQIKVK